MSRTVAATRDPVLAALWRGLLERAGIPAFLADQQVNALYGGVLNIEVVVRDEDYDEARRLLDEARREAEAGGAGDLPGT